MKKSGIAFGSEFSPEQVDLAEVLEVAERHEGNSAGLLAAVQKRWYPDQEVAKNLPLSLKAYGLIADGSDSQDQTTARAKRTSYHLTAVARRLLRMKGNQQRLHGEFAKHILLSVPGGMDVVDVLQDLEREGTPVTMAAVRRELARRGLHIPRNSMSATRIRLWLERGGVVKDGFRVDETRKTELLGYSSDEIEALAGLSKEQKAFAKALARLNVPAARSNDVASYAEQVFAVEFPDTGLPSAILAPLVARGLIVYEKTTAGRGGKPGIVRPTAKLRSELFEPLLKRVERSAGKDYRAFVRMSWAQVLKDIASTNPQTKGKGLEALAAKLAFLLDLDFRHWRLRGPETGGAEVDLVVESSRPVFLRWNIQCKNTKSVRLDDVAKEVGLAVEIGSSVVVVVSTGKFSADAREHAKHVMARTNMNVILMNKDDIAEVTATPARIHDIIRRAAELARSIKGLKVRDYD